MNRNELHRLTRSWRRHYTARRLGWSVAVALGSVALLVRLHPLTAVLFGAILFAAVWWCMWRRTQDITAFTVVEHLNRICPSLEESADLWLREAATLSWIEHLQLRRLNSAWVSHRGTNLGAPNPKALLRPLVSCGLAALLFLVVILFPQSPRSISVVHSLERAPTLLERKPETESSLKSAALRILPPHYLNHTNRSIEGLDAEVEEGSEVVWNLKVSGEVAGVELQGAGTNGPLAAGLVENGRFQVRSLVMDTRVYRLAFLHTNGTRFTNQETHLLKVIRDSPPQLSWESPATIRTWIDPSNLPASLPIGLQARDDHQVTQVHLVLTLTQGSGEGVRFREQILPLTNVALQGSSTHSYAQSLDLTHLELQPGDELYFHAVAFDNKTSTPNQARSDTRFVTLRSPESVGNDPAVVISAIRRNPQFFRSQRQLILDTDQLLADRSTLSEDQFRTRSENLGIDQKLLRLRYGHFLGETFESTAGEVPHEARAMASAAALRNQTNDEVLRDAAIGRASEAAHEHEPSAQHGRESHGQEAAEMLASLAHIHDSPEAATLFDDQVKSALRAALAAMWEAEGHLRTARPEAALPAENRALEILKALQQADRISVRRVGFDLPPLKIDERRLQGELDTIPTSASGSIPVPAKDETLLALREAIASLSDPAAAPLGSDSVARVDSLLVQAVQSQPDRYLQALDHWRSRGSAPQPAGPASASDGLRHALWSLVPPLEEPPQRRREEDPGLETRYLRALTSLSDSTR